VFSFSDSFLPDEGLLSTRYHLKWHNLYFTILCCRNQLDTSTFHHHFRTLTAMSPLQYQKWLRLNEARRLMLTESLDASTAAFEVGYESPSQFSREYSRLFGAPPLRDISILREMTA
jgi:AraC-like DNA-binding protein